MFCGKASKASVIFDLARTSVACSRVAMAFTTMIVTRKSNGGDRVSYLASSRLLLGV